MKNRWRVDAPSAPEGRSAVNLRDIEYFVAVAELGGFGKAADRCFVSQPTLSGQLKKLEEELGHALFERSTRIVRLTPFGTEALGVARRIVSDCAALSALARELDDPFAGTVSVGAFPTLCPWLLPRLSPVLKADFPRAAFRLVEEKSPVLRTALSSGDLDAALLALPLDEAPGAESVPLFSEPFYAAVPDSHPWACRDSVDPAELAGQNLLLLEDGHCLRDQALDLCRRYGAAEGGSFRATSLETLRQMVRLGSGITLMPRLAVPDERETGISYLPFSSADARREIGLCFRSTHPRRAFFLELAARIRSLCGASLPVSPLGGASIPAPPLRGGAYA